MNNIAEIKLLIVGESPYPTNAVPNEAFCKPTWTEQVEYNCSGRYVLCSLGVDFSKAVKKYSSPPAMFSAMNVAGVFFQNVYLELNVDKSPKKKSKNPDIDNIIARASKVVLCGRETHFLGTDDSEKFLKVIHPAARCKSFCREWAEYWGAPKNLLNRLEPNGLGPIHAVISNINR